MIDSMMYQKYQSQLGKKYTIWIKSYYFQTFTSWNLSKSPQTVSIFYLLSTSLMLEPLRYDDIRPNQVIQHLNKTLNSPSCYIESSKYKSMWSGVPYKFNKNSVIIPWKWEGKIYLRQQFEEAKFKTSHFSRPDKN